MKVAVVTGAAKGLGREIAKALALEGYTLAICYKTSKKEAEELLAELKQKSPKSIAISGDLADEKEVQGVFDTILKTFGHVDLLVNNVGNFLYKEFGKTTNEEFRVVLESNVYSTLYCSRAVLPSMRENKSGYIINIGCVGCDSITAREKSTPYFMAKSNVFSLTKIMAWEEARNGIHVNMISPASLIADIFKTEEFPMGRSATPQDVINALLFLISPDTYYINGANIEVAGGFIPGMSK